MSHLLISCAEAARRISESQDARLGRRARLGLWLHLAVCRFCRRYLRQVRFMRRVLRQFPEHLEELAPESLSLEARQKILRSLEGLE